MAIPIPLEIPPRNARAELQARLQNAPLVHAEALLSAYEVLQGLHDRGGLEILRGALGSSDRVLQIIVDAMQTPDSVRTIRNVIISAKILGTIEPELMEGFARALPEAIAQTKAHVAKTPGLGAILKKSWSSDSRRGLFLATSMLEAIGRNLPPDSSPKR